MSSNPRRAELASLAKHAGTVYVGQVAVMAFGLTDTLVAGRHSGEALAALSVGSAVYISIFVALLGVLQAPASAVLVSVGSCLLGDITNATPRGVATGTLSSTVAEAKTVSATISGVGINQTATVTVRAKNNAISGPGVIESAIVSPTARSWANCWPQRATAWFCKRRAARNT